jgi:hypothetical protein
MAWWTLYNQEIDLALLVVEMKKEGRTLYVHEIYSWGEVKIQTKDDTPPEIDLKNLSPFNLYNFDWCEDFEGGDYKNQSGVEFKSPQGVSKEEIRALKKAYDADWITGLEKLGWADMGEQQWWLLGPLRLEDEQGNLIGLGDANKQ